MVSASSVEQLAERRLRLQDLRVRGDAGLQRRAQGLHRRTGVGAFDQVLHLVGGAGEHRLDPGLARRRGLGRPQEPLPNSGDDQPVQVGHTGGLQVAEVQAESALARAWSVDDRRPLGPQSLADGLVRSPAEFGRRAAARVGGRVERHGCGARGREPVDRVGDLPRQLDRVAAASSAPSRRADDEVRRAVAGQVGRPRPHRVAPSVPQPRQRRRLDPRRRRDRVDRVGVGRWLLEQLLLAVDVDDGQPGPRRGQRPAVPAGHHLVGVVGGVGVVGSDAVRPGQRRALQEPGVRLVLEDRARALDLDVDPAAVQRVPGPADVVPHLEPDPAGDVLDVQRRRLALHERVVPGCRVGQPLLQLLGPVEAGDGEAGGSQPGRRRGHRVAVRLRGHHPRDGADVLLQLEAGGVRVEVEHGEAVLVADPQQPERVVAGGGRGEEGASAHGAGGGGLQRDGVRQVGNVQGRSQLDDAREQRDVVDPQVDHQPEPAQQRREVAEHGRPLVEVRVWFHHRLGDRVLVRPFQVVVLQLRPLVIQQRAVGVGGEQLQRRGLRGL